ncbi:MAG: GNAT family N-acetyltransferase [Ruminococcaceae bacterium]|nr:GNAT family N-acetyltransferase [Oscillospiraceae bacterium]
MLSFRPFEEKDAQTIISWIMDEFSFRQWSADTYKDYPVKPDDIINRYKEIKDNHKDGVYLLMFTDDDNTIGHLIVRVIDKEKGLVRFGYIIVDSNLRGQGYGSKMLRKALEFARNELYAKRVTLGVFENNQGAATCYKAVGFRQIEMNQYTINGEVWNCPEMECVLD